jgi:AcrR family transcriptional regulator
MVKDIKKRILEETLNELDRFGPDFHMDDLARRLRISKRTLYENFPSKQDVVREAIFSIMDDLYEQHAQILADSNMSAEDKLIAFFTIRARTAKVFSMKETSKLFAKMPELCELVRARSIRVWKQLEAFVEEAQRSNEFVEFDKQVLMHMLHGAAIDIFDDIDTLDHDYSFPEYMEACIRMILYGIKRNGGISKNDEK